MLVIISNNINFFTIAKQYFQNVHLTDTLNYKPTKKFIFMICSESSNPITQILNRFFMLNTLNKNNVYYSTLNTMIMFKYYLNNFHISKNDCELIYISNDLLEFELFKNAILKFIQLQ
jgi:hypothetical protein